MGDLVSALRSGPLLADGGIGSYLFELTGRLSEGSHVYEGLNLSNPDLVRGVHAAYLQAGARCMQASRRDVGSARWPDDGACWRRAGQNTLA